MSHRASQWRRRSRMAMPALLLAAACDDSSSSGSSGVERIDSAGIEIVTSPSVDRPLRWRFEPVVRLGGAEEGPEGFYLLHEWVVDADAGGHIAVLDPVNARVVVFDSSGSHLRSFGRRGGGPGEMEEPVALSVDVGGAVAVADDARGSLLRWDSAGHLLPSGDPIRVLPLAAKPFALAAGRVLAVVEAAARGEDSVAWRLVPAGSPRVPIAAVVRPRATPKNIGCAMGLFPPLFAPDLIWDAKGERIAIAAGSDYEIRVLEGEWERRIRRPLPEREVSREMALQEVRSGTLMVGFRRMTCSATGEARLERQGFHPVLSAFAEIEIGWDGSVWVQRAAIHGEPRYTDVFDADGAYVGTLPADSPFPVEFLPDGSVVAIESDELHVDRLVIYRVVRQQQ